MGREIDFISSIHKATKRDYLARVNDAEFPKYRCAELASNWAYDYWDGDRRICYGGYDYQEGRWSSVAASMVDHYGLKRGDRILDVGCGKGFQLVEFLPTLDASHLFGLDISDYALSMAHANLVRENLFRSSAADLPFESGYFDFVYSINTLHNLSIKDLFKAIKEIDRVAGNSYIVVESYRSEKEKQNLLYWQVTCKSFYSVDDWLWIFDQCGYCGDYSFIFFE